MTLFHLIRHGDYSLLGQRLAGRLPGYSLSEKGRAQAKAIAEAMAGMQIATVVSSPLERTRETAAPIAAARCLPVTIEPDFNEIDFGRWTGMSFSELHHLQEWRAFNECRGFAQIPGGETMLAAQARSMAAVLRLRESYPGGDIVIVSHGDVVKAILAQVLGLPLDLMRRIEVSPGSRSVVALGSRNTQ
ncbi:MAG: histidine phosphatase family protein, partial [Acetobacteraceae bacterium]|nr:histidine phosphatase family protein [Acetobacteraceae bacterium]